MKSSPIVLTPALLVCVALPVLFLLAPDGIPCVYAGCGTHAGGSQSNTINVCRNCSHNVGSDEIIIINSASVTGSTSYCELYASVNLRIEGSTSCDAVWLKYCMVNGNPTACGEQSGVKALDGPTQNNYNSIYTSSSCDTRYEVLNIELFAAWAGSCGGDCDSCECKAVDSTKLLFDAKGNCYYP